MRVKRKHRKRKEDNDLSRDPLVKWIQEFRKIPIEY